MEFALSDEQKMLIAQSELHGLPPRAWQDRRLRLARQAQPALANDVLLDVGRAAADDEADIVHVVDLPGGRLAVLDGLALGLVGEARSAKHIDGKARESMCDQRAVELDDEAPDAGVLALGLLGQQPQTVVFGGHHLTLQLQEPLAVFGNVDNARTLERGL